MLQYLVGKKELLAYHKKPAWKCTKLKIAHSATHGLVMFKINLTILQTKSLMRCTDKSGLRLLSVVRYSVSSTTTLLVNTLTSLVKKTHKSFTPIFLTKQGKRTLVTMLVNTSEAKILQQNLSRWLQQRARAVRSQSSNLTTMHATLELTAQRIFCTMQVQRTTLKIL